MKSLFKLLMFVAVLANLALSVAIAMLLTRMMEGDRTKLVPAGVPSDRPVPKAPTYADVPMEPSDDLNFVKDE